jgi:arylformamidase
MIHDATVPLRPDLPTWPGELGARLRLVKALARGDEADVRELTLGIHTGTHVDAPGHFVAGGGTVESIPLEVLVGRCRVVDVEARPQVTAAALDAALGRQAPERLVLRTRNSAGPRPVWESPTFVTDYAAIAPDGARWLVDHGVRLVGVDYLSVEPFDAAEPLTHRILLGAGVVAIEGLDLRAVPAGAYRLHCLTIPLVGAEGAPARVLFETGWVAGLQAWAGRRVRDRSAAGGGVARPGIVAKATPAPRSSRAAQISMAFR